MTSIPGKAGESGIPSWARKGQRVVCVDAGFVPGCPSPLLEGGIYCIECIHFYSEAERDEFIGQYASSAVGVLLEGVKNTYDPKSDAFAIARFQPVVELKSDNEIEAQIYHARELHQRAPRRKTVSA